MNEEQYKILSQRRIASNNLVWQAPTLGIAAQAFLLAGAFNPQMEPVTAAMLCAFSLFVGLAALQLVTKHRYHEVVDAELMAEFEGQTEGYSPLHAKGGLKTTVKRTWLSGISSYKLWRFVLAGFCILALYGIYTKLKLLGFLG
jgi:hypothetical protein